MKNTKKYVWRLKEQPTAKSIQELVSSGILTKDEARQMIFSSESDRDKKSLESEIKFLRELVEKLSERSQIASTVKAMEVPYKKDPWFPSYTTWYDGTQYNNADVKVSTAIGNTISGTIPFSSIKTF